MLPTGSNPDFTWNVSPSDAGTFNGNEFSVSANVAHGASVTISATAGGITSNLIVLTAVVQSMSLTVDWVNFYNLAPDSGDFDVGTINLLTGGTIMLKNLPDGVTAEDIGWYFGGSRLATGLILQLNNSHLGDLLGPRFVTVVVMIDNVPYSRRLAFTVTL
jgi:hypothetical protein